MNTLVGVVFVIGILLFVVFVFYVFYVFAHVFGEVFKTNARHRQQRRIRREHAVIPAAERDWYISVDGTPITD